MLSLSPSINKGTTFSTRPDLESKPNPSIGIDIEMAGSASIVFDMTAVARLH
jgi:hypothetical protein